MVVLSHKSTSPRTGNPTTRIRTPGLKDQCTITNAMFLIMYQDGHCGKEINGYHQSPTPVELYPITLQHTSVVRRVLGLRTIADI